MVLGGTAIHELMPLEEDFMWMCFVYVVCLGRRGQHDIGDTSTQRALQEGYSLGFTHEELIEFFQEVGSHIWQTRKKEEAAGQQQVA